MLQALYGHVRAGQLEEAIDLCRKANQPWRAASIRGALLFQWRAICESYPITAEDDVRVNMNSPSVLANEPRDEDAMDDEDAEGSQRWHGNVRREMWKTVCQRAALNVSG